MALIEAIELTKSYSGKRVVDHISFEVNKGEIVGLLGPNGAGKTTTFRMCMGMIPSESGKVRINGRDVSRYPMYRRARMGLGYLSQEPSVFQRLTVEQNILAILETMAIPAERRKERSRQLLADAGLTEVAGRRAYQLSGGERRRLEIARALVTSPLIMLLDEPFSGVDPKAVSEFQKLIQALRDQGIGILLTDHNVRETLTVTDRAYIIDQGRILMHGLPEEIVSHETVRKRYLGDEFTM